jgi:hypothetical protein
VAVVEGRELQATRAATEAGAGTCVGQRGGARTRCASSPSTTHRSPDWSGVRDAGRARWEITVAGPTATDSYFNRPQATRAAKIRETLADGGRASSIAWATSATSTRRAGCGSAGARPSAWKARRPAVHRTGRAGVHVHPQARRTALVGVGAAGAQVPVLCVELLADAAVTPGIEAELRALGAAHAATAGIDTFLRHPAFPVDIRHNAKIGREKLAVWAGKQLEHRA